MKTDGQRNSDFTPQYNASDFETKIYQLWEQSASFAPAKYRRGEKTFSIIMPPPNANGALHVGHAVGITIQDLLIRYHRMRGEATVWFPGLDHAGFETQVVFEKYLEKQGINRFQLPRDEFYQATWEFTKNNSEKILSQFKRLGASADWQRTKFTLDTDVIEMVYATFVQLWEDELVYRDERSVHWCPKHQTTLSDLEVVDIAQRDPLYYLKYGLLVVATGRPETIFGDVAVAVNPRDQRYRSYVGKMIEVDFGIEKRTLPVIADEMVDIGFGTGAVKITPAHDPNDFEVARRHQLPKDREAIDRYGKMTPLTGPFAGLKVEVARKTVVEMLQKQHLIDKIDDQYTHTIKVCYKCKNQIEPRILPQWFIAVNKKGKKTGKNLSMGAKAAVKAGEIKFITRRFRKIFDHWMANIRDWNISRQIMWGIRLPVWYCRCGNTIVRIPISTELIFLRHGEARHNVAGIGNGDPTKPFPLTSLGKQQMKKVIKTFQEKGYKFDLIFASEMPRVQESAQLIATALDGKVITDQRLNDINLGGLEGQTIEILHKQTNYHQKSIAGSETLDEVETRVEGFLQDLYRRYGSNKRILVVTSEIVFWALRKVLNPDLTPHEQRHRVANGQYHLFSLGDLSPCNQCGRLSSERDRDVFDSWFSSGQWPVIVPKTTGFTDDFHRFYPTNVMETGWDIIFFWVARMIMLGIYLTDQVPFNDVYLHGLVTDQDRQKMSKSKGNVLDPLATIDQYGTDALRMALVFGTAAGNNMPMSEDKVRGMRNFVNKLWNVSRFVIKNQESRIKNQDIKLKLLSVTGEDRVIIEKLDKLIKDVKKDIENYRFHQMSERLYHFVWHDFADRYLEQSKKQLEDQALEENTVRILFYALNTILKLLHPLLPFVTEAIWQRIPSEMRDSRLLINTKWPKSKANS